MHPHKLPALNDSIVDPAPLPDSTLPFALRFLGLMGAECGERAEAGLRSVLARFSPTTQQVGHTQRGQHLLLSAQHCETWATRSAGYSGSMHPRPPGFSHGANCGSFVQALADELLDRRGAALAYADGTYTCAAVDAAEHVGILARDKFGVRQIFYTLHQGKLFFSDDLRSLLELVPARRFRLQSMLEWQRYGAPLAPEGFFHGVLSLPAGHMLRFDWKTQRIETKPYFEPVQQVSAVDAGRLSRCSEQELEALLLEELNQVISRSCAGRARVTTLLSGGVDSSFMTAIARDYAQVDAVTVDLQGPEAVSEVCFASRAARMLGVELRVATFSAQHFHRTFCESVYALGSPLIIENAVALYYAAKSQALPSGQLILDGEGADAIFAGSDSLFRSSEVTYLLSKLLHVSDDRARHWQQRARELIERTGIATSTPVERNGFDVLLGSRDMGCMMHLQQLLDAYSHLPSASEREIAALMLQEFYQYLVPLMARLDRMAWAAQAEVALPFLSHGVAQIGLNLPIDVKVRLAVTKPRLRTKWLLKRMAAKVIDPRLVYRPKVGFGIPGGRWTIPFPKAWQPDSWIAEQFGLGRAAFDAFIMQMPPTRERMFVNSMEAWGRLFDRRQSLQSVEAQYLAAPAPC